jgi:isopentenyldiphosphate isomerase
MEMELVDTYDESLNVTGVIDRESAHRAGILHKTVHCWFVDLNYLYFQIRGKSQDFPELLDVTAGGHISHGETTESALHREVWEELGVELSPQQLTFIGQNTFVYRAESVFVKEFSDVFIARANEGFSTFLPNPTELSGIAGVPFKEGRRLILGEIGRLEVEVNLVERGATEEQSRSIERKSFVPSLFEYFIKMFEMGERFGNGQP